jgi:rubrerythrin
MAGVKETLTAAIEFEKRGESYYMRFHDLVGDKGAKALMKSLANDEKEHARILTKELSALGGRAKPPSKTAVEKGLREIFPEGARKGSLASKDSLSALRLGIRTEERSIAFYSKNGAKAGPELKAMFGKLETMERGHLDLLKENLRNLEDEGSWYGYVPILEG